MSEFNNTPIVVGQMATSYGEMRERARSTQQQTDATSIQATAFINPALLAGAVKGLCESVLFLINEVERLTNEVAAEKEESK